MATKHPCAGLSAACRRAFEQFATGMDPICTKATIAKLLDAKVIVRIQDRVSGGGRFAVHVPQYDVPLDVHWQWCQWCVENVKEPL